MNFIDKTKRQFDRWAKIYDSFLFRIYFEPIYKRLIGIVEKKAGEVLLRGGKFLDVACGTGEIIYRLGKEYPKSKFFGIDLSPEMIKKAKEKVKNENRIIFQVGTVDGIPFQDNTFDIVLCSEAFHHFEHPKRALKEMHRVLKKGGMFLLMDPAYDAFFQRNILCPLAGLFETAKKNYSKAEFMKLLGEAGFTVTHSFYWRFNNFFTSMKL